MKKINQRINERLAGVPRYQPGVSGTGPSSRKLSSNEAALGPGPTVTAAAVRAATTLGLYPDEANLRRQLADHLEVDQSELLLTNGSDELCSLVATVFLSSRDLVVVGDPAYQIDVKVSRLAGAAVQGIPLVAGRHDLPAMARVAQEAALVWLPTPHNPTGAAIGPAELEAFIDAVPATTLIVIDQAYIAFADPEFAVDAAAMVRAHPNMLFQRTLSKHAALAGARIGYGIGSPEVIDALARVRAPFSVNAIGLAAASASLAETGWRDMVVSRTREGRTLLEAELTQLALNYLPSQANFVMVEVPHARIAGSLAAAGISVRPGEDLGLPGWVRITVGWAPIMADVRRILRAEFHADRFDVADQAPSGRKPR